MTELAFLLDVDNTLLDNDRLKSDLEHSLRRLVGEAGAEQFWETYEEVRESEEYVDFPATLRRFAELRPDLPQVSVEALVDGIDFRHYVYPGVFEALDHLTRIGLTVIVSDGDQVFQKRKITESGLAAAVGGRVMLTVHKQAELDAVFEKYPATHYALIDDKTTILADVGSAFPERITTVLVCQGKYARLRASRPPDLVVPHIADLIHVPAADFLVTEPTASSA